MLEQPKQYIQPSYIELNGLCQINKAVTTEMG